MFLRYPSKAEGCKSSRCSLMNNLQMYFLPPPPPPVKGLQVSNPLTLPQGLLSEQRPTAMLPRFLKVRQLSWLRCTLLILELSPEGLVAQSFPLYVLKTIKSAKVFNVGAVKYSNCDSFSEPVQHALQGCAFAFGVPRSLLTVLPESIPSPPAQPLSSRAAL